MRFLSPYTGFQAHLWTTDMEPLSTGNYRVKSQGYVAQFRGGDFTDYERQAAYERFGSIIKKGSRFEDDNLTIPASTDWRIGTFDTALIPDIELRSKVEKKLLAHPSFDRDYILVEKPRLEAPWPNYPDIRVIGSRKIEHVCAQIREVIAQAGVDLDKVEAFERENLNRKEVLEMLDEIRREVVPEPEQELIEA